MGNVPIMVSKVENWAEGDVGRVRAFRFETMVDASCVDWRGHTVKVRSNKGGECLDRSARPKDNP